MTAKKLLNKTIPFLTDSSLIYTVLLVTSVMYYYRSVLTHLWIVLSFLAVMILFKIFDFIAKHKFTGPLIYIAVFICGIYAIAKSIQKGAESYPINFLLWFITTQDALDYSKWYTIAVFIFFTGFFASVVYYFTKVRYRISMSFLVFMIPFIIYGKESRQMPALLIILLCIIFAVNMIHFNNIRNGDDSITVGKSGIFQSSVIYILAFGITASLLPKPKITADRTYLESLINMDAFTDMLISKINIFNNQTESNKFNSLTTNEKILYYAKSDEPLRLKTQVFTDYNYASNQWSFDYDNDYFKKYHDEKNPSEIIKLIVLCSELDKNFAKKYNINSTSMDIPDAEKKNLSLYSTEYDFDMLPVPTWLINTDTSETVKTEFSDSGTVRAKGKSFSRNSKYDIEYYSDSFIHNADVCRILTSLSYKDAWKMYQEMYDILYTNDMYDESCIISDVIVEAYYASDNLDYGENQKIYDLAMQITEGLESDYEKALAIEGYFLRNNYIYDLTYRKPDGENDAETFLFETKRGVCYEYATAMVMLSRACGIPARYAEGYNMNQLYEKSYDNYIIRIKDAHGFPELYISGIGWMSFEPTVSDTIIDYEKANISKGIYISGIVLAVLMAAGLLLFKFYPEIINLFFMFRIKKSDPDKTVSLVFIRVRQIFGFGKDVTAKELCQTLNAEKQTDISTLKNLFEKSAYGKISLSENDKKEVIALYSELYKNFRKSKKQKNKI